MSKWKLSKSTQNKLSELLDDPSTEIDDLRMMLDEDVNLSSEKWEALGAWVDELELAYDSIDEVKTSPEF